MYLCNDTYMYIYIYMLSKSLYYSGGDDKSAAMELALAMLVTSWSEVTGRLIASKTGLRVD